MRKSFGIFPKGGASKTNDMSAKLAALDKSQATIEFELDGTIITANQNFLSVMGRAIVFHAKMQSASVLSLDSLLPKHQSALFGHEVGRSLSSDSAAEGGR